MDNIYKQLQALKLDPCGPSRWQRLRAKAKGHSKTMTEKCHTAKSDTSGSGQQRSEGQQWRRFKLWKVKNVLLPLEKVVKLENNSKQHRHGLSCQVILWNKVFNVTSQVRPYNHAKFSYEEVDSIFTLYYLTPKTYLWIFLRWLTISMHVHQACVEHVWMIINNIK